MRLGTALVCVLLGIWLAYNKPELANMVIGYINMAVDFVLSMIDKAGQ